MDQANGNSPYSLTADVTYSLVFDGNNGVGVINHSAGKLTVSNVLEVGYNAGSNRTLGGNLSLPAVNGFTLAPGQTFTLLQDSGASPVAGAFANAPTGIYTDAGGNQFLVSYTSNTDGGAVPNDVTVTVVAVPEPSTWVFCIGGALLLGAALYRSAT